jgi:RecA-family ATPase
MRVKRVRTALVSREDYAGTTSRFIRRFRKGNGIDDSFNLGSWLWIHSRQQRKSLLLDKPEDLNLLIHNLKSRHIQFCILDVLNVLHQKDENDNTEMRKVLTSIDKIRDEVGCQVMLLHHAGKAAADSNSVVGAGRGATAMDGFAEFKIRIKTEDEDEGIKSIRFKTKAGEFQKTFHWKIRDLDNGGVTLTREQYEKSNGKRRAASV